MRGDLCFGPNQGQHVTFVNPRAWMSAWPSIEPEQALQELVRRYLRATTDMMQRLDPSETIRLLPLFDAYTIGMPRDREQLLNGANTRQVFRPQGWISAVALVNGSIQGVWQQTARRSQTVVKVQLFYPPQRVFGCLIKG